MTDWTVQVQTLGHLGNWKDVLPHTFELTFESYRDTQLLINGRPYHMPWRIFRNGRVIAQSDGYWMQRLLPSEPPVYTATTTSEGTQANQT